MLAIRKMKVGRNVFCGLVSSFVHCLSNSISVHCTIVDDSLSGYDILLWGRGISKDGSLEYTATRGNSHNVCGQNIILLIDKYM